MGRGAGQAPGTGRHPASNMWEQQDSLLAFVFEKHSSAWPATSWFYSAAPCASADAPYVLTNIHGWHTREAAAVVGPSKRAKELTLALLYWL